jgi:hypothetical protein
VVVVVLLVVSVAGPPVLANEGGRYVTNPYQDSPQDWNDPWVDEAIGPRNEIAPIDGHVGSGVRVTIPAGGHFGAAMRWRFADNGYDEPEQLWFRYYLRFPVGFVNTGKGKLPGPAGLYSPSGRGDRPSTPEDPGWSARMLFSPTYDERDTDHTRIGYYLYHVDQEADHGDLLPWDEAVATLRHGRWYCVEGMVELNTPGVADGELAGWVDGIEAFRRDDIRFRRRDETAVKIDSFWFDVFYGGKAAAPDTLQVDFDSLSFGEQRLGCDDSAERGFAGAFFDDEGSMFESDIEQLRAAGVIDGCNQQGDAFCPDDAVTRGQMAKILAGALRLPAADGDYFNDDDGSQYEYAINALAAAGVTNGCAPDRYCPNGVMSRGAAAAFISRAVGLPGATVDFFGDDVDSQFEGDINALAAAGITSGCGDGSFCPSTVVTRSQAAALVARAMRLVASRSALAPAPLPRRCLRHVTPI